MTGISSGPFQRIAVIGCGLVGGSFALASQRVPGVDEVIVTDRDAATRAAARSRGLSVVEDARSAVSGADLIVVAVPVPQIPAVAHQAGKWMNTRAVLTDVGSIKGRVVNSIVKDAPVFAGQFVGGHPMTGSERQGFSAADPDLFESATYVLTPVASTSAGALDAVGAHVRLLGCRVLAVGPETHDRLVAVVSHLPQVLSSTLMRYAAEAAAADPGLLHMAGGGFRDVTRVAGSDPDLWADILRENREAVGKTLAAFTEAVAQFRCAIDDQAWDDVRELLSDARRGRRLLPGKATAQTVVDVVVPVTDEPGSLATVTTALGEAGVNIEDVSMRHIEEGGRGVVVVAVSEADADRAQDILAARGLRSHLERR